MRSMPGDGPVNLIRKRNVPRLLTVLVARSTDEGFGYAGHDITALTAAKHPPSAAPHPTSARWRSPIPRCRMGVRTHPALGPL